MVCCRLQYNLLTFYFSLKELPANSHIDHVLQFWFYIQQHDDTDRIALEVSIDLRKAQYEKQLAGKFSSLKNKSKPHKILSMKRSELIWCDLAKWTHDPWLLHPSPPSSRCRCHAVIFLFHSEGREEDRLYSDSQSDKQSPSVMFLWSPCRIIPQTEADLQQAQAQSTHCQDPEDLLAPLLSCKAWRPSSRLDSLSRIRSFLPFASLLRPVCAIICFLFLF